MRAVIWDWAWYEENDDLRSFDPDSKAVRELLPGPPLPPCAEWSGERPAKLDEAPARAPNRVLGVFLIMLEVAAASAVVSRLGTSGRIEHPVGLVWLAAVIALCAFAAVATYRHLFTVTAPPAVRRLSEEVPASDLFPVRVRIVQDRVQTGGDHGVAWFAKDALHFKGLRTEFVIGAQDLRYDPLAIGVGRGALQRGWAAPSLALRHPERAVSVEFVPMDRLSPTDLRDCGYRFRHHLRLFLRRWRASRVDSLYPPLSKQPTFAAREAARPVSPTTAPRP